MTIKTRFELFQEDAVVNTSFSFASQPKSWTGKYIKAVIDWGGYLDKFFCLDEAKTIRVLADNFICERKSDVETEVWRIKTSIQM